jgi:uncharacterized membrane protein
LRLLLKRQEVQNDEGNAKLAFPGGSAMTIVIGILAYLAIMTGILVFFRFVRSTDDAMHEVTLNAAELRPAVVVPLYHRQSA